MEEPSLAAKKIKECVKNADNLTEIIECLTVGAKSEKITLGHIVEQFKYRGFGPLMLIPALFVILPTGAIPMLPAFCGLILGFICLQIVFGREHPWIPKRLEEFSIPKATLENAVKRAKPYTQRIDRILHERLTVLIHPISKRLAAACCCMLCIGMILIGFIPLLPAVLALPVLFFGLGYIARDGLMIGLGFLTVTVSATALYILLGSASA